ncbi:MAG: hypothetical protein ACO1QR_09535 [Chthoniobacteraceae bacterium]
MQFAARFKDSSEENTFRVKTLLDNVLANLELMPLRVNMRKGAAIGQRQRDLARRLVVAGLLSEDRLRELRLE